MSIADELQRITNAQNRIKQHLVEIGLATGNETLDELAPLIEGLVSGSGEVGLDVQEISASYPDKVTYKIGEALDFSDIVVSAINRVDVTNKVIFNPPSGTVMDTAGKLNVSVSYTENGNTKTDTIPLSVVEDRPYIVYLPAGSNTEKSLDLDDISKLSGSYVTISGESFYTSYIREIHLNNEYDSIPANFMNNSSYLRQLDGLDSVKTIGDNFLKGCSGQLGTRTFPLILKNVESIGNSFLLNCIYEGRIVFSEKLKSIGSGFMQNCSYFNSPLTIPGSVETISNSYFMYGLNAMTSTLTLNCPASLVAANNYVLATNSSAAECYTKGIPLAGPYVDEWMTRFPNRASNPFRKLIVA